MIDADNLSLVINKLCFYIMTLSALFLSSCTINNDFQGYRYNPFQYPYPEYYLKAESITIPVAQVEHYPDMVKLEFFGFTSHVPRRLFNARQKSVNENEVIYEADGKVLIIYREIENLLGCVDEEIKNKNKDFCSSFTSTRQYYEKLFTLTPDTLRTGSGIQTGDKWIVHRKGFTFENATKLIKYVKNGIEAYGTCYKPGKAITKDMILFAGDKTYHYTFATNISETRLFEILLNNIVLNEAQN
jgi:hypothetical protein